MVINFEEKHVRTLEQYAKRHKLPGKNAAIRHILDNYDFPA